MSRPIEEYGFDPSRYERPNHQWLCGRTLEGRPCHVGPSSRGECRADRQCIPHAKGDRWTCTRPKAWGGTCSEGPMPDGICPHRIPKCQPMRSILGKRRIATFLIFSAALGALLFMLGGTNATTFVSPGELTRQHSSIRHDCSACHSNADAGFLEWTRQAVAGHPEIDESSLCLDCHEFGGHALSPHSQPPGQLAAVTERLQKSGSSRGTPLPFRLLEMGPEVPRTENGELACATCHQEHRGRDAELARISDIQCQTCHQNQFHGFSNGHPEFTDYPYERRTRLYFDHSTHYGRHFKLFKRIMPDGAAPESCRTCHELDFSGDHVLVKDFEVSCADCHAQQIEDDVLPGVAFFRLPRIDKPALDEAGLDIGSWPEDLATTRLEKRPLPPVMQLLLNADPEFQQVQRRLENVNPADLSEVPGDQLKAVADYVWAVKSLVFDVRERGRAALTERLETALAGSPSRNRLAVLVGAQSNGRSLANVLSTAADTWLPELKREVEAHRRGEPIDKPPEESEGKEPDTEDSDTENASAERSDGESSNDEPSQRTVGWYRDKDGHAIRYRPSAHADAVLRSWLEVSNRGRSADDAIRGEALAGLYTVLSRPTAPGRCMKCHTVQKAKSGTKRINWFAKRSDPHRQTFNRFSHRPHLTVLRDEECSGCHVVEPHDLETSTARLRSAFFRADGTPNPDAAHPGVSGFHAMQKSRCAECHRESAVGESCLRCHNYHIGRFRTTVR